MSGYSKLFSSILASTIWEADMPTRIVWITLLAMSNARGKVEGSVPGLATFARVPLEQCRAALANLKSPDADSRSKEHEGRRIMDIDGGWLIINYEKYRNQLNQEERREYLRVKQAEYRGKKAAFTNVNNVSDKSTELTQAEAEAEAEATTKAGSTTPLPPSRKTVSAPSALDVAFQEFWNVYPKKVGKVSAFKAWQKIKPDTATRDRVRSALDWQILSEQWQRDNGQFIPNPATWLNQGRWDDEPIGTAAAIPSAAAPIDWWEECKALHAGACEERMRHHIRMQKDKAS